MVLKQTDTSLSPSINTVLVVAGESSLSVPVQNISKQETDPSGAAVRGTISPYSYGPLRGDRVPDPGPHGEEQIQVDNVR